MNNALIVGGIMLMAIAVLVLGWERRGRAFMVTARARPKGLKGLLQWCFDWGDARLKSRVGGELPTGVSAQRWLAIILAAMGGVILLFLWLGFGGLALLAGGVAGYVAATAYANSAMKKRRLRLEAQVKRAAEIQLAIIRAANKDAFPALVEAASTIGAPFAEELRDVTQMSGMGERMDQLLAAVQEHVAAASPLLVQYLAAHREIYRPTDQGRMPPDRQADILEGFVTQAREEERLARQIETLAAPGRTTRWLVVGIIVGILLFEFIFQPDTMRAFVATSTGQVSMVIVTFLVLVVVVLGERIARVE